MTLFATSEKVKNCMSGIMKKLLFTYAKSKKEDQLCGSTAADQLPCFRYIVQSLCFLNLKCQAFSHQLGLYSLVCVGPGLKPQKTGFLVMLVCIFLQTSEGTPTVTGWFEVSVGGKLIHSKKVNS